MAGTYFKIHFNHLPAESEENHQNSGQPVFMPRLKPRTFQIWSRTANSTTKFWASIMTLQMSRHIPAIQWHSTTITGTRETQTCFLQILHFSNWCRSSSLRVSSLTTSVFLLCRFCFWLFSWVQAGQLSWQTDPHVTLLCWTAFSYKSWNKMRCV